MGRHAIRPLDERRSDSLDEGQYSVRPFVEAVSPGGVLSSVELATTNLTAACGQRSTYAASAR